MADMARVHFIIIANAYEPGNKGTVWVVPNEFDTERDLDPEVMLDNHPRAIRIVGPIEFDVVNKVVPAMRRGFEAVGVDVIEHALSDD